MVIDLRSDESDNGVEIAELDIDIFGELRSQFESRDLVEHTSLVLSSTHFHRRKVQDPPTCLLSFSKNTRAVLVVARQRPRKASRSRDK
jgi:hypothetical protein